VFSVLVQEKGPLTRKDGFFREALAPILAWKRVVACVSPKVSAPGQQASVHVERFPPGRRSSGGKGESRRCGGRRQSLRGKAVNARKDQRKGRVMTGSASARALGGRGGTWPPGIPGKKKKVVGGEPRDERLLLVGRRERFRGAKGKPAIHTILMSGQRGERSIPKRQRGAKSFNSRTRLKRSFFTYLRREKENWGGNPFNL